MAWEAEREVGPKFEFEFELGRENELDADAVFRWKLYAEAGREAEAETGACA